MGGECCVGGKRRPNPVGRFIINQYGVWNEGGGGGKVPKGGDEERRRRQEGVSQGLALLLLEEEKGRDWEQSVFQTVSVVVHVFLTAYLPDTIYICFLL